MVCEMMNSTENINNSFFIDSFDFNIDEVTGILHHMGLASNKSLCRAELLSKYIFLYGDQQEIYNSEERKFIESAGEIYIYNEFYKKTKRGLMPCRVIAADSKTLMSLEDCIFFMKVINKAIEGFNIFFLNSNHKFYVGMKLFNRDIKHDCIISSPTITHVDMEELCDKFLYITDSDNFIEYYGSMALAIEHVNKQHEAYEMKIIRKRGIDYSYPQMLLEIEREYNVKTISERDRYYNSFEELQDYDFNYLVSSICEDLSFIKSFKANTMEMLFEAEEMARLEANIEEEDVLLSLTYQEEPNKRFDTESEAESDTEIKAFLNDPEMMIKMLKQKKGIPN